jgi:hypothetical protein
MRKKLPRSEKHESKMFMELNWLTKNHHRGSVNQKHIDMQRDLEVGFSKSIKIKFLSDLKKIK